MTVIEKETKIWKYKDGCWSCAGFWSLLMKHVIHVLPRGETLGFCFTKLGFYFTDTLISRHVFHLSDNISKRRVSRSMCLWNKPKCLQSLITSEFKKSTNYICAGQLTVIGKETQTWKYKDGYYAGPWSLLVKHVIQKYHTTLNFNVSRTRWSRDTCFTCHKR